MLPFCRKVTQTITRNIEYNYHSFRNLYSWHYLLCMITKIMRAYENDD